MVTDYLYDHARDLVHGRTILELGAGAGLPSIATAIWGAKQVVVTDYPDEDLVENMRMNIDAAKDVLPRSADIVAKVSLSTRDVTSDSVCSGLHPGTCMGCIYGDIAVVPKARMVWV